MKAVILAAGEGSRFRRTVAEVPKPCWNLMGLTLVERAVRCAAAAGCEEAVVVTGYAADQVESCLNDAIGDGRRGNRLPIPVRCVRAEQWSRGNGASLLAAGEIVQGERFLLLMSDHVMDAALCRQAVGARDRLEPGEVLLLVDTRLDQVDDLDEATKVRMDGRRIIAIGKELDPCDGADTGVFIGGPRLLEVMQGLDDGAGPLTLTAAAARLAAEGQLVAEPVTGGWWVDVDDAQALSVARQRLLRAARGSGGDGPVAKWLNRPLSIRFTNVVANTGLTPNGVTWIAFAVALAGAATFAVGLPWIGGLLVQLASILDGSDGELARLRLETSAAGSLLDTVLDRYADAAVIAGLMLGALGQGLSPLLVVGAAMAALAGAPLSALIKDRMQWLAVGRGEHRRYNPLLHDPRWLSWLPVNRDGRCFVVFLAGLIGQPLWALLLLGVVVHIAAVARVVNGMRRFA